MAALNLRTSSRVFALLLLLALVPVQAKPAKEQHSKRQSYIVPSSATEVVILSDDFRYDPGNVFTPGSNGDSITVSDGPSKVTIGALPVGVSVTLNTKSNSPKIIFGADVLTAAGVDPVSVDCDRLCTVEVYFSQAVNDLTFREDRLQFGATSAVTWESLKLLRASLSSSDDTIAVNIGTDTIDDLKIMLNSGSDIVTIEDLACSATINLGSGDDVLTATMTTSALTVESPLGDDEVHLVLARNILGDMTVIADSCAKLFVDDRELGKRVIEPTTTYVNITGWVG